MTGGLDRIRQNTRREVQAALDAALTERERVEARLRDLDAEIALARKWLGDDAPAAPAPAGSSGSLSLHGAMELVLREHGGGGMKPADLAEEIERRGLYRRRDGLPAGSGQVQARVSNYPRLFERAGGLIRLRAGEGR